jgi:hypothetical protein
MAIAGKCDGVRCDMAMLLLPEIFQRTWSITPEPFWPTATAAVREKHPAFTFMAEVYWDLEWKMLELGFDYAYDKRLYDRLVAGYARPVREHLSAGLDYQVHLARFLENHDEPRAATELGPAKERAAAVVIATSPGAALWHEGQFEGWQVHLPVLLGRRPTETVDEELRRFHLELLQATTPRRRGAWALCDTSGWPEDSSHNQLLAWSWIDDEQRTLVVINYADTPAAARIHPTGGDLAGRSWRLEDVLSGQVFERDGTEMATDGLYVELPPWQFHVFACHDEPSINTDNNGGMS